MFYYPIVVTSSPVYVVDTTEEPLTPQRVPWATMSRQIKAKNIAGQFYVDVVTAKSLHDSLAQRIGVFTAELARAVAEPTRFVTHKDHSYSTS